MGRAKTAEEALRTEIARLEVWRDQVAKSRERMQVVVDDALAKLRTADQSLEKIDEQLQFRRLALKVLEDAGAASVPLPEINDETEKVAA